MRIDEVELLTADLPAQQRFYAENLGLGVAAKTEETVTLQAGSSRLTFRQAPEGWSGYYHFAFNIPENRFSEAKEWLSARTSLIADKSGATEFDFRNWNAHALYFYDAAGNIVEFIARHGLPNATDTPFDERGILSISEIGLPTDDVSQTVELLHGQIGIPVYDGAGSDMFTAVGNQDGLFIVVKAGRVWFPDTGKPAQLVPVSTDVSGPSGFKLKLVGPPYEVA